MSAATFALSLADLLDPPPNDFADRWETAGQLAKALEPSTVQTEALDVIDAALADVEAGRCDRVMVFMPPQEGKSTRVTTFGPLWFLRRNPDRRVAIVSYAQDLAEGFGRNIRNLVTDNSGDEGTLDLGLRIAPDNGAARRWELAGHRGGVRAVGIRGGLTGRPVDVLFIDDPISNMEQAQSTTYRSRVWDFWQSVANTRLAPGAPVVIVLTRWHEDDLAGRLLAAEDGHRWRVISIPAIAERDDDPLGRKPGEPMRSARGQRDWAAIRTAVGEYVWAALYQQRPAPAAGGLFKRDAFRYWAWTANGTDETNPGRASIWLDGREQPLDRLWKFLTVDLAISKRTSADYTAAGVWGITPDGDLILLDGLRTKIGEADHFPRIDALRRRWNAGPVFVEAAQHGTTLVYEAGKAGVRIEKLIPDTDKFTRALPAAKLTDARRLWLPAVDVMPGVVDWLDELTAFPNAAHDDTVDVVSYAARVRAAHWLPPADPAAEERARVQALTEQATGEIDLESAVW